MLLGKADVPRVADDGIVTDDSDEQLEKAQSPICVTDDGIVTDDSDEQ